eukprot:scaffold13544_cov50-Attheya_sp.AAC.5
MGLPDDSYVPPPPHTAGSAEDVQIEAVAVVPTAEEYDALSVPLLDRNATEPDLVEVMSPAALPEGYTFDIIVNHKPFTITVPTGGVEEGQIFSLSLPSNNDSSSAASMNIPRGAWRDGVCSCCRHGCCHASLCIALFCPLLLLGQVMTRLRLDWLGNPMSRRRTTSKTFQTYFVWTVVYLTVEYFFQRVLIHRLLDNDNKNDAMATIFYAFEQTLRLIWVLFSIVMVTKVRGHVRAAYHIPEHGCRGCEDCCCAVWCTCCTVAQLSRHTADYDTYNSQCCTATGLPDRAPSNV